MEAGEARPAGRITKNDLLEVESSRQNGNWLVEARGEIDFATVGTLEEELQQHSNLPIVLDLRGVEFIDSSGIKLLMKTAGRLAVGGVSPPVERLIQLCALERVLRYD